jgi:uncharacterized protein YggE
MNSSRIIPKYILIGVVLLAASSCALAAEINVSKLIVQGEGKASAAPDMATIVLGVETRNASASAAAADNARLMNNTVNALRAAGIAEKDIQTSRYSLTTEPQEEPKVAGEKPKVPEFIATNQVTIRLNDTSDVGKILDAAVSAGSNSIQEVSFDLMNPKPEKDKALTFAIEDAGHKAEVAAKAAGVKLGKVLEISEGYGYVAPAAKSAVFADGAITPIQPGEMVVTSSVTLTYEIT